MLLCVWVYVRFGNDFGADAGSFQVTAVYRMNGMIFQGCGNQSKLFYPTWGKVDVEMAVEAYLARVSSFSVAD